MDLVQGHCLSSTLCSRAGFLIHLPPIDCHKPRARGGVLQPILVTPTHKPYLCNSQSWIRCSPALPTSTRASAVGERAAGGGGGGLGWGGGGGLGPGSGVARPPAWFTGGWLPVPPGEGAAGGGPGRVGPAGAVGGGGASGGSGGGEAGAFKGRGQTLGAQCWGRCAILLNSEPPTHYRRYHTNDRRTQPNSHSVTCRARLACVQYKFAQSGPRFSKYAPAQGFMPCFMACHSLSWPSWVCHKASLCRRACGGSA